MAVRVRDFSHAHPSSDQSFVLVLDRLEKGIGELTELENAQTGGYSSRHSATVRRRELRRRVRDGLLRHLVTVADDAAAEVPELLETFQLPEHNVTTGAFQAIARKLLEQGVAHQEVLIKHGLSVTLLDDLKAGVDQFDALVSASNDGLLGHVMARSALQRVSDEIIQLVEIMDGINRYRFADQPELLAAWDSARHVVTGPRTAEEQAEERPASPGSGEVQPAA
jgi:hypothetical protein